MYFVACVYDETCCFSGDAEQLTLVWSELHGPVFFPLLEGKEIQLEEVSISLCADGAVQYAVISEQPRD